MSLYQITGPVVEPLTLIEAKKQVNQTEDFTDDDAYIEGLIPAARQRVEESECALQLITATYELRLDCFPVGPIIIPKAPLVEVLGITYIDTNGVEQTFGGSPVTGYDVDIKSPHAPSFGEIHLAYGESWPVTRVQHNAVTVEFTCGFGDKPSDVPAGLKAWMLIALATMYSHRESEITGSIVAKLGFVDCLLDPWRAQGKRVY